MPDWSWFTASFLTPLIFRYQVSTPRRSQLIIFDYVKSVGDIGARDGKLYCIYD